MAPGETGNKIERVEGAGGGEEERRRVGEAEEAEEAERIEIEGRREEK